MYNITSTMSQRITAGPGVDEERLAENLQREQERI